MPEPFATEIAEAGFAAAAQVTRVPWPDVSVHDPKPTQLVEEELDPSAALSPGAVFSTRTMALDWLALRVTVADRVMTSLRDTPEHAASRTLGGCFARHLAGEKVYWKDCKAFRIPVVYLERSWCAVWMWIWGLMRGKKLVRVERLEWIYEFRILLAFDGGS